MADRPVSRVLETQFSGMSTEARDEAPTPSSETIRTISPRSGPTPTSQGPASVTPGANQENYTFNEGRTLRVFEEEITKLEIESLSWRIYATKLFNQICDDRHSVYRALLEIREGGYLNVLIDDMKNAQQARMQCVHINQFPRSL